MKYHLVIIALALATNSCHNPKASSISILGNWKMGSHTINKEYESAELRYAEFYITVDSIFMYDIDVGFHRGWKYYLEKDILVVSILGSEFKEFGRISKLDSKLVLEPTDTFGLKFELIPVNTKPTLEKLIRTSVTREEYWDAFFKRYQDWGN